MFNEYVRDYFRNLLIFCVLLITCFLLYAQILIGNKRGDWGVFHYYIGAKYSTELGYTHLYNCATRVKTDRPLWNAKTYVRDLSTYRIMPREQLPPCPFYAFSKQRLQSFIHDINLLTKDWSPKFAADVVTDKGFNPPPTWVMIAGPLANLIPLGTVMTTAIFHLDILAFLAVPLILWIYVDATTAALSLLLSLGFFGTFGSVANGYLQYLWYPLITGAIVMWRKKRYIASGVLIAVASVLQVFPAFFILPIIISGVSGWIRRKHTIASVSLHFLSAWIITVTICIGLSILTMHSLQPWISWSRKISIHKAYLKGEVFDVGVTNIAGLLLDPSPHDTTSYKTEYPATANRIRAISSHAAILGLITILIVAFVIWQQYMKPSSDPFFPGHLLIYTLLSLSPYYMLTLTLIPYISDVLPKPARRFITIITVILIGGHMIAYQDHNYVRFSYQPNLLSQASIVIYTVAVMFAYYSSL